MQWQQLVGSSENVRQLFFCKSLGSCQKALWPPLVCGNRWFIHSARTNLIARYLLCWISQQPFVSPHSICLQRSSNKLGHFLWVFGNFFHNALILLELATHVIALKLTQYFHILTLWQLGYITYLTLNRNQYSKHSEPGCLNEYRRNNSRTKFSHNIVIHLAGKYSNSLTFGFIHVKYLCLYCFMTYLSTHRSKEVLAWVLQNENKTKQDNVSYEEGTVLMREIEGSHITQIITSG